MNIKTFVLAVIIYITATSTAQAQLVWGHDEMFFVNVDSLEEIFTDTTTVKSNTASEKFEVKKRYSGRDSSKCDYILYCKMEGETFSMRINSQGEVTSFTHTIHVGKKVSILRYSKATHYKKYFFESHFAVSNGNMDWPKKYPKVKERVEKVQQTSIRILRQFI